MNPALAVAAAAFAATTISSVLFVPITLALAPFARVAIEKGTVGFGPRLFTLRVRGAPIEVRAVPAVSSVTPVGALPRFGDEAPPAPPPPPSMLWIEAPRWRRVLAFVIAPRLVAFAIAAAVVGWERAGHAVVAGVGEIVTGAIGPFSTARAILDAGAGILAREGFVALAAIALCKTLSLGLAALPSDLAFAATTAHGTGLAKLRIVPMLAIFGLILLWIVAWIGWLAR